MLPKAYDPKAVEDRIYKMWEGSGAFKADLSSKKEPFTISMPPPNATGQLHLGHAVMLALEDIFIRFNRMKGKEALWFPGTDHAAIAVNSIIEKSLAKDGKTKEGVGRDEFLKITKEFVENSQDRIKGQVRKMGSSCDWSRESYTMNPSCARCTYEAFKDMYATGVIYRGNRIVNWDTKHQTTISDDEVFYKEIEGTLYTFEYLSAEQTGGKPVFVSTSRPETKLGDTALAVNPKDKRYKNLVGKEFDVQWPGSKKIHVIVVADDEVDPKFGTGVVGVTPLHSFTDFDIWQKNKTKMSEPQQVIGEDGCMTKNAGDYAGIPVEECRQAMVEGLRKAGRLKSEDAYTQQLSIAERSKHPIEPLPKLQWFVDVNKPVIEWKGKKLSIKEVMQDTVRSGMIKIIPERFNKTYFQWIDNLRDWCISRQIWWGHQIPVWYKGDEVFCDVKPPEGKGWEQDPDTLDTWYGVAQWTWSPLIDPKLTEDYSLSFKELLEKSEDFMRFHPTQVMETGYDILFFWVARMILMTTYCLGRCKIGKDENDRIPFKHVYLHGLIRTRDGQKMSKSHPETMIDPLDIIPKYGADALRLAMIVGQSPGNDSKLYEEKIAGYRNFINKLWNASRFVLMQCEEAKVDPKGSFNIHYPDLSLADKAVLAALQDLTADVTKGLEEYRLSETGERLYSFIWDYFCDWYLELSKGESNPHVLIHVLRTIVRLLHPYCPFVTEELWESIKPECSSMLIAEPWPEVNEKLKNKEVFNQLQIVIDAVSAIRKLRADQGIEPGKKITAILHSKKHAELLEGQREHIMRLARLTELNIDDKPAKHEHAASTFLKDIEVHLPLEGLIDIKAEKAKLEKEKKQLQGFLEGIEAKLNNKKFMANAPEEVVKKEKDKQQTAKEKLSKIEERLKNL